MSALGGSQTVESQLDGESGESQYEVGGKI